VQSESHECDSALDVGQGGPRVVTAQKRTAQVSHWVRPTAMQAFAWVFRQQNEGTEDSRMQGLSTGGTGARAPGIGLL